jgi:hypothetical protein
LWRLTRRHHDEIGIAVAIDVEDGKRSAVLIEVESERPGNLFEASVPLLRKEDVPLMAGDRAMNQQLIDRPPGFVIRCRAGARVSGEWREHLTPEEFLSRSPPASLRQPRQHAVLTT